MPQSQVLPFFREQVLPGYKQDICGAIAEVTLHLNYRRVITTVLRDVSFIPTIKKTVPLPKGNTTHS
jgi:hypothetical protein